MRILTIVETAYRATLEEQDDTILWLNRALQNAGADLTVLLRGNAVNYLVAQTCPPLTIGSVTIQHPAQPNEDLAKLEAKGARILAVQEDLDERGIDGRRCLATGERIRRADLAELLETHDHVWHW